MRTLSFLGFPALLSLLLATTLTGCTAFGYAGGSMLGAAHRRTVSNEELGTLRNGQEIWVHMTDGAMIRGEAELTALPETLFVRRVVSSNHPWSFGPRRIQRESIAVGSIRRIETPRPQYAYLGLALGAMTDVALFAAMITRHESRFYPDHPRPLR